MKQLITISLILAAIFASTFLILTSMGLLTVEGIEAGLKAASEANAIYVIIGVVALLFADIFIAVPTLTIAILSGYFLGFGLGALSANLGMVLAGVTGYGLCRIYGPGLLKKIYSDPQKREEMQTIFNQHGSTVLLICRSMPILPEVSCCMAGANKMRFVRFLTCYLISTVPYATIAAFAGSRSSLDNPQPAIYAAIGLSLFFWMAWVIFIRKTRMEAQQLQSE
ncbi:TVP38/TMEM64 family protein [Marinimicrobium agarilyticum]|uniref:TVP38/TMEM64 family protein n=1 Tax=Marinimicrobium agarilyticum TaxID=306546 RepID=UPI0004866386|nr:VTT domain-containing protein [Marinimicrobium agarilyticum]